MSTVTKLGVYGLAVAAAFAVAFAVLVTAPRSSVVDAHILTTGTDEDLVPEADASVEAYTESAGPGTADDGDDTNDVPAFGTVTYRSGLALRAGDSAYIRVFDVAAGDADPDDDHTTAPPEAAQTANKNAVYKFSVIDAGDADATFKSGGKTTLNCNDARTSCDLDGDWDEMTVQLVIASDAAEGESVVVNVENVNDSKNVRVVFRVTGTALAVSGLDVDLLGSSSASRPATFTGDDASGAAIFTYLVKDNQNEDPPVGFAGQEIFITSTNSTFGATGTDPGCREGSTRCTVTSDTDGGWIQVRGTGVPGPAKLTVEAGGFTVTKDITFYGPAKSITAEAEQGSVEVGGEVFIVVTVTDGAGNGISGRTPTLGSGSDSIKGPSTNAIKVTAVNSAAKDLPGTANDLPACSEGTTAKGVCVMKVTAPNPTGTANDAARGKHVVTVVGAAPIKAADRKVQVTITVAGAVDAVSTNAPERVDPGSSTEITVTVVDDEGVRAGAQSVTVTKIAGDGVLRNGGPAVTKDGQHTFTYRAASRAGRAEFDVDVRATSATGGAVSTGKVLTTTSFTITVGEEAAEPPPAPPAVTIGKVSTDAPERVDPGSSTEITVTVVDDEGARAGAQTVTVTKISGDGVLRNGGPALTDNGQLVVTYRAASSAGTAEFDVAVRAPASDGTAATSTGEVLATTSFIITVGEEAPPAPPAPAAWFTPSPTGVAGYINSVFRGGSLSDLQGALLDECSNNGVAAYVTAGGVHVPYIAGARVSAANAAFRSSTVVDGMVPASTIFLIAGCGA